MFSCRGSVHTRRHPAADSIDTVGKVLLRDGRSGQTAGLGVVHNGERGSLIRRHPETARNAAKPSGSIASQWIRAAFSAAAQAAGPPRKTAGFSIVFPFFSEIASFESANLSFVYCSGVGLRLY